MAQRFAQTTRALGADSPVRPAGLLLGATAVVGLWLAWAFTESLPHTVASRRITLVGTAPSRAWRVETGPVSRYETGPVQILRVGFSPDARRRVNPGQPAHLEITGADGRPVRLDAVVAAGFDAQGAMLVEVRSDRDLVGPLGAGGRVVVLVGRQSPLARMLGGGGLERAAEVRPTLAWPPRR